MAEGEFTKDDDAPDVNAAVAAFGRYSDDLRQVMRIANREAKRHWRSQISTLDVLIALAKEPTGLGGVLLRYYSATPKRLRRQVRRSIPRGRSVSVWAKLRLSEELNSAVRSATRHAIDEKHDAVGTGGLLLVLLRTDAQVEHILRGLGVDVATLQSQLARALHVHMVEAPGTVLDLQAIVANS